MPTLHRVSSELLTLRHTLKALDRSLRRLTPLLSAGAIPHGAPKENGGRRPPRLSAKARASLVLQGRYMGYMRQLKPSQKAQVRMMRAKKGMKAATASAKASAQA